MKEFLAIWLGLAALLLAGCATSGAPRAYVDEDAQAHYYATKSGQILRVEGDGTVIDVTCAKPAFVKGMTRRQVMDLTCQEGRIMEVGKASRMKDGEWQLGGYDIAPETGTCTSLFAPFRNEWLEPRRHSCWNRLWEIPAAAVVYSSIGGVAVGLITSPIWIPLLLLLL